ncbi:hypothetical protein BGX24_001942 [Mortierella sp. AD032]|nr:hypothetical protein BGX24_001942 [Mortierella sp. AD032]
MQVQSTVVHSLHSDIKLSSLLSFIQGLVEQSARGFQDLASGIPLRKITKVIYYACLVVGVATIVVATTSSVVFAMPIPEIAAFVARYFGRQALAPLIEQIIVAVSVSGVSLITGDYVWTKKQLNVVSHQKDILTRQRDVITCQRDAVMDERDAVKDERDVVMNENNALTNRVATLETHMEQVIASINASLVNLANANHPINTNNTEKYDNPANPVNPISTEPAPVYVVS